MCVFVYTLVFVVPFVFDLILCVRFGVVILFVFRCFVLVCLFWLLCLVVLCRSCFFLCFIMLCFM